MLLLEVKVILGNPYFLNFCFHLYRKFLQKGEAACSVNVIHWVLLGLDLNRKESAQSWSKKVEDTRMEKNLKLNSQANGVHLSLGSVNDAKKSITRFQRTQL